MKLRTLVYSVHVALTSAGALVTAAEQQAGNNAAPVAPVAPLDAAFLEAAVKSIQSYRHDDSAMRELLRQGHLSLMDWESVMLLQQLGCTPRPERLQK